MPADLAVKQCGGVHPSPMPSRRLTVGLGFREWGAREVCSNGNLVQVLASQMRGNPSDAHNWRFAFIQVRHLQNVCSKWLYGNFLHYS